MRWEEALYPDIEFLFFGTIFPASLFSKSFPGQYILKDAGGTCYKYSNRKSAGITFLLYVGQIITTSRGI